MRITRIPVHELTAEQLASWGVIASKSLELDSPFYRPEFTQAVAAVRENVEVAVVENENGAFGFFPFQRSKGGVGLPVGYPMCDFQGIIADSSIVLEPAELIRACRLNAWNFDCVPSSQMRFRSYFSKPALAPYMDLSGGFDVYRMNRANADAREIPQLSRRMRKVERELGELRFLAHNPDPEVFAQMIEWKRDQYRTTGVVDVFSFPWTVALLKELLNRSCPQLSILISTLHIGNQLAAVHYGMVSNGILHGWFPVYDPQWARYSTGIILWGAIAKASQGLGIRRIDLGKGDHRFKNALMSGAVTVYEGSVTCSRFRQAVGQAYSRAERFVRSPACPKAIRNVAKACARIHASNSFR